MGAARGGGSSHRGWFFPQGRGYRAAGPAVAERRSTGGRVRGSDHVPPLHCCLCSPRQGTWH